MTTTTLRPRRSAELPHEVGRRHTSRWYEWTGIDTNTPGRETTRLPLRPHRYVMLRYMLLACVPACGVTRRCKPGGEGLLTCAGPHAALRVGKVRDEARCVHAGRGTGPQSLPFSRARRYVREHHPLSGSDLCRTPFTQAELQSAYCLSAPEVRLSHARQGPPRNRPHGPAAAPTQPQSRRRQRGQSQPPPRRPPRPNLKPRRSRNLRRADVSRGRRKRRRKPVHPAQPILATPVNVAPIPPASRNRSRPSSCSSRTPSGDGMFFSPDVRNQHRHPDAHQQTANSIGSASP